MRDRREPVINRIPAVRGLAWITGCWELFRRQPIRLLLVSLFFQFFLGVSQSTPLGLLVILCLPVLSAGMLHAFFMVERGEKPLLAVLFMPFIARRGVSHLLLLGGVVMVLGLMIVSFTLAGQLTGVDPELLSRIEQGDLEAIYLIDPGVMESAILAMAVGAAVSGCITYFSVPLIWFNQYPMGSAVMQGLKGLARNWRPLLVIGVVLGLLAVPMVLLAGSFYVAALSDNAVSSWLGFLMMLLGPMFQLLLFGTQYLSFRDIYGLDDAVAGEPGGQSDDQLVA